MNKRKVSAPVLIELEDTGTAPSPADAPPIGDALPRAAEGRAMQSVAAWAGRPPSRLVRWFWSVLAALTGFLISVAAWDFATALLERNQYLGFAVVGLFGLFLLICLALALREWVALARLRRLDSLRRDAETALAAADLDQARRVTGRLLGLYRDRAELAWGRDRFAERSSDPVDADAHLALAETELIAPLDAAATREVEAASRQVATITAIVPLALADVAAALFSNLRMIRRIAQIYGGRAGTLGSWRLARSVLAHLVATGAVAVGDDLIGSVAGGGLVSKLSRRFGEGLINGALTARVGIAAMEVCRPLPFFAQLRPSVTGVVKRALAGLFASAGGASDRP